MISQKKQERCYCGWLERSAADPASAVNFDAVRNEYHLALSSGAFLIIDRCFVCGGSAPESNARIQLHTIKEGERERLQRLTEKLKTAADVLNAFGEPDLKQPARLITVQPSPNAKPQTAETYPVMTYLNLSQIADVRVTVDPADRVTFTFRGKPVVDTEARA